MSKQCKFYNKNNEQNKFLVLQENVIDKTENLIKENQPCKIIVYIVCKGKNGVSKALLLF